MAEPLLRNKIFTGSYSKLVFDQKYRSRLTLLQHFAMDNNGPAVHDGQKALLCQCFLLQRALVPSSFPDTDVGSLSWVAIIHSTCGCGGI